MKMNDFVTRTSIEEIRSGTFSSAQGGRFGSASSVSFEKRQSIDRRKAKIRSYQDSMLARSRFSRQGELMKTANSSLQSIENRRMERRESSTIAKFRNESLSRNKRVDFRSGNLSNISQSGMIGVRSSTPPPGHSLRRDFIQSNLNINR